MRGWLVYSKDSLSDENGKIIPFCVGCLAAEDGIYSLMFYGEDGVGSNIFNLDLLRNALIDVERYVDDTCFIRNYLKDNGIGFISEWAHCQADSLFFTPIGGLSNLEEDTTEDMARLMIKAFVHLGSKPFQKICYLAGPDIFSPGWNQIRDFMIRAARGYGFFPLVPGDQSGMTAKDIYEFNVLRIRLADFVLANMSPFRGAEPDSGTVFEIGFAAALGKPVFGFSPEETYIDIVEKTAGLDITGKKDWYGHMIDDFGFKWNLMLGVPVIPSGSFHGALLRAWKFYGGDPSGLPEKLKIIQE